MPIFSRLLKTHQNGPPKWIIAGLGNPGAKYEGSRHNVGFLVADELSKKMDLPVKNLKFKALCGLGRIGNTPVLLMKPQTFVNLSGEAVRTAASFYKIPPECVLVIFDDMSLPVGRLRIRRDGSDGGHNGIKSIISELSSDRFPRIKIGIGEPPRSDYDAKDWVLGKFSPSEQKILSSSISLAVEAVSEMVAAGVDSAMNRFNGKS